MKFKVIFNFLL